jgi:hypothetical protein
MFGYTVLATMLALSAVVAQSGLPDCAADPRSCECPFGITLSDSTTIAIIGAAAGDVKAITGSCELNHSSRISCLAWHSPNTAFIVFQTDWFGTTPESTSGVDNTPGSSRTLVGETAVGTYSFVEEVNKPFEPSLALSLQVADPIRCRRLSRTKSRAMAPSALCFSRVMVRCHWGPFLTSALTNSPSQVLLSMKMERDTSQGIGIPSSSKLSVLLRPMCTGISMRASRTIQQVSILCWHPFCLATNESLDARFCGVS